MIVSQEMQADEVLDVRGLSKVYSRSVAETRKRLGGVFARALFGASIKPVDALKDAEFWALNDINFTLKRGETLGVIGLNGAGKTTLLRILAGQILPDKGEVRQRGTSASMIDLTAGFNVNSSGRRNIFLRGAVLGRSRQQILDTMDEVIEFSELAHAIDAPFSGYSSGMRMRLAFAIMIVNQPQLLFIDEVLAVGDFRFKQKCLAKLREFRETTAFVMVSHSLNDISRFCERVLVLDQGRAVFLGEPPKALEIYQSLSPVKDAKPADIARRIIPESLYREDLLSDVEHYWCNAEGQEVNECISGQSVYFHCRFKVKYDTTNLIVGVPLYDLSDTLVTGISTDVQGLSLSLKAGEVCHLRMAYNSVELNQGTYQSAVGIVDGVEFLYTEMNPQLHVRGNGRPFWGPVSLPHMWERIID